LTGELIPGATTHTFHQEKLLFHTEQV